MVKWLSLIAQRKSENSVKFSLCVKVILSPVRFELDRLQRTYYRIVRQLFMGSYKIVKKLVHLCKKLEPTKFSENKLRIFFYILLISYSIFRISFSKPKGLILLDFRCPSKRNVDETHSMTTVWPGILREVSVL